VSTLKRNCYTKKRLVFLSKLKKLSSIYFPRSVLFIALIPYAFLVIIPSLFLYAKWRGKPKALYHFVEGKVVFDKILKNKILLSLAGGKLHTTNEMNPFLGLNADSSRNEFYVLAIDDQNDIKKFEPIINLKRTFHAYKWWKHFRNEYTYQYLKDIKFELKCGSPWSEKRIIDGVERDFEIAYIKNLNPLENEKPIQKAQKFTFWAGEIILSLLVFYVPLFILCPPLNCWFFAKINEWLPSEKMTIENIILWVCLILIAIEVLLIGLIFLHRYLRNGVIKSRE